MKSLPTRKAISTERSRSGFTLIELLVVIAILAVLAVIGFASFQGLSNRGNDARRASDIKAIADAYEVKRGNAAADYGTLALTGNDFAGGAIPTDPVSTRSYCIRTGTAAVSNAVSPADITAAGVCAGGAGNGSTGWNTFAGTALAASQTHFKICVLKQDNSTVVCVGSKQ